MSRNLSSKKFKERQEKGQSWHFLTEFLALSTMEMEDALLFILEEKKSLQLYLRKWGELVLRGDLGLTLFT